jgi:exosortase C (VPDSG-CTERM-specific)
VVVGEPSLRLVNDIPIASRPVVDVSGRRDFLSRCRAPVVQFAVFAVVLVLAFCKPLLGLIGLAANSELHSYLLVVPFVSAYLLYVRRKQLPTSYQSSFGWAAMFLLLGGCAFILAWIESRILSRDAYFSLTTLSFVCFFAAGGFVFLGKQWMRAATFPLFFLVFMIPMPGAMVNFLETASKLGSAEATGFFFDVTGTPVLRDGLVFQLPGIAIQVAQECSGIRSSWVLLMTSLVAANLFMKTPWRRAVLVGFVVPLGIIRNGFRVFVIGTLCIQYGPQMIHSIIHRRGGPLFFVLSLLPLFLLLFWLRRAEIRAGETILGRVNLD